MGKNEPREGIELLIRKLLEHSENSIILEEDSIKQANSYQIRGVMAKVLDCGLEERKFGLYSLYSIHFLANTQRGSFAVLSIPFLVRPRTFQCHT